jgi:peptidoglycan/xylan/chitin deacetylase (PgdA/CDA1 family)
MESQSPKQHTNRGWAYLQVALSIMAIAILVATIALSPKQLMSTVTSISEVALPSPTPTLSATPTQATPIPESSTSPAQSPQPIDRGLKIPILMYHYIRDFHSDSDKVGTNLSVSPAVFAQQLAAIKAAGYTSTTFNEVMSGNAPKKPIIITFDDGYNDAYSTALPILQSQEMRGVFYIVSGFLNTTHYITTDQMKALDVAGMEIGSHTVDHKNLAGMDRSAQEKELRDSKTSLESLIGKAVTAFCYPSGKYNTDTTELAKSVGYTTATTTKSGIATGGQFLDIPYELVRVRITNNTDILKALKEQ